MCDLKCFLSYWENIQITFMLGTTHKLIRKVIYKKVRVNSKKIKNPTHFHVGKGIK